MTTAGRAVQIRRAWSVSAAWSAWGSGGISGVGLGDKARVTSAAKAAGLGQVHTAVAGNDTPAPPPAPPPGPRSWRA